MEQMTEKSLENRTNRILFAVLAAAALLLLGGTQAGKMPDAVRELAKRALRESAAPDREDGARIAAWHPLVILRANIRKSR